MTAFARKLLLWLILLAGAATNTACVKAGQKPPSLQTRTGEKGQPAVSPSELVSLTEELADTYAISIAQAVNQMQEASSPEVRKQAQRVKTFVGATAYALAASPNPEIAMIDLVTNISVQRSLFASGMADRLFGDLAPPLIDAYADVEQAGWTTLKRVYTDQQLGVLRDAIHRWLAANPRPDTLPFIRAPNLAKYRNISRVTTPGSIRLLAPVAEAARTAMELRLLGERSLFIGQRYPFLLNWYGEQVVYDVMAAPETQDILRSTAVFSSSARRMSELVERLPNLEAMKLTLDDLNGTLAQAGPLLGTLRGVIGDFNLTLGTTDRLLAPFQTRAIGGGPPERTFDVSQYALALRELGAAAGQMNTLLVNTSRLVESPELAGRLGQVQDVSASGLGRFADQGNRFIDRIFWRGIFLIAAFFVMLLAYRVASASIARKHGSKR